MKLSNAKLCAECDEIVPIADDACFSCLCTQFFHLSSLIQPNVLRAEIDLVRMINSLESAQS